MGKAVIASKSPFLTTVVKNKTYAWCSCGLSKNQPLCDGSHGAIPLCQDSCRL